LDKWQLVAQKKEVGGFGIPDMRSLNMPLLSSWIFRYGLQSESIWVKIVDHKYNNNSPNIICSDRTAISPFWKGVMWALQAARMGFKWLVGNGRKVRFWEDHWFDNSSLAIQFWPLYVINDQQGKTINQVWDGQVLILSFRRAVSENLMNMWFDLLSIVESVRLQDDNDQIIWCFNSNGKYFVQSLYAVISNRGVVPVFVSSVWKLKVPLRIQIFLWLVTKNKILTRDNLAKRRELTDKTCLFCNELESVNHLLFDCCVARGVWLVIAEVLNLSGIWNFEFIATFWLAHKKHLNTNIVASAVLWCLDLLGQGRKHCCWELPGS
jgi:hypothetical protein